jgi:peptidoglycan/LPS O-acetylase OafA/YrhL
LEIDKIKSRVYGLDILRAAAITCVMFSHGYTYSGHVVNGNYYKWLVFDGVGLFFVLSGFLIGGILIRKIEAGNFGLKQLIDFWIRRWLRTLPAYFCVLTFLIGCYYISHKQLPPVWFRYYFFIQNFASPHPLFFAEAWSLSVEEWFYLLVPIGLFFLLHLHGQKRRLILGYIFFVLVLITCMRLHKVMQHDYVADKSFGEQIIKVVIYRMDAIMYGVLGAWLSIYYTSKFYEFKRPLLITGLIVLIGSNTFFSPFFHTRIQYTLAPIAVLFLLPALSALKEGKGRFFKVITFISIISYSIYLTNHMIVLRGIMPFLIRWLHLDLEGNTMHNVTAYILFWAITIVAAYVLYRLIEKPFMDLRGRLRLD